MTAFQEASDPNTPAARLAGLAFEHPEVRPIVALHPAAYDGLLDWLDEHGDANTKAAVAQRRGAVAAPAPVGYAAAVSGAAATPQQFIVPAPAAPRAPLAPATKRLLLLGGVAVLVVAALVVVAVVVIPRLVGGGGASTISVASYGSKPSDSWTLDGPAGAEADAEYAVVRTVGQDRGLVFWIMEDSDDTVMSLIDTSSGSVLWETAADGLQEGSVVAANGAAVVLSVYSDRDGRYDFTSLSLSDGRVLGTVSGDEGYDSYSRESGGTAELLVRDDDELAMYSPDNLDDPRWSVELDGSFSVTLAGSRVIVGKSVYGVDGSNQSWKADKDKSYYDVSGTLVEVDGPTFAVLDPSTGDERWSADLDDYDNFAFVHGLVLLSEDDTTTAFDSVTGDEVWDVDGTLGYEFSVLEVPGSTALVLPLDGDLVAVDARSGDGLWEMDGDGGDSIPTLASSDLVYVDDANGDLVALGARDGERRWKLSDDGAQFVGGRLVGVDTNRARITGYR